MEKSSMKQAFENMKEKWGPFIARTEIRKATGGAISEKRIANLDSAGEGPAGRFRIGKKVCYPTDALIEWLEGRAEVLN